MPTARNLTLKDFRAITNSFGDGPLTADDTRVFKAADALARDLPAAAFSSVVKELFPGAAFGWHIQPNGTALYGWATNENARAGWLFMAKGPKLNKQSKEGEKLRKLSAAQYAKLSSPPRFLGRFSYSVVLDVVLEYLDERDAQIATHPANPVFFAAVPETVYTETETDGRHRRAWADRAAEVSAITKPGEEGATGVRTIDPVEVVIPELDGVETTDWTDGKPRGVDICEDCQLPVTHCFVAAQRAEEGRRTARELEALLAQAAQQSFKAADDANAEHAALMTKLLTVCDPLNPPATLAAAVDSVVDSLTWRDASSAPNKAVLFLTPEGIVHYAHRDALFFKKAETKGTEGYFWLPVNRSNDPGRKIDVHVVTTFGQNNAETTAWELFLAERVKHFFRINDILAEVTVSTGDDDLLAVTPKLDRNEYLFKKCLKHLTDGFWWVEFGRAKVSP